MRTELLTALLGVVVVRVWSSDKCAAFLGIGLPRDSFASPKYPNVYPPNQDCVRTIRLTSPGYDMRVVFREFFQVESSYDGSRNVHDVTSDCPNDFLEFRDGRYGFSPLLGRFCGMQIPTDNILAKSGYLWVRFRSDDQLQYRGFHASLELVRSKSQHLSKQYECHFDKLGGLDGTVDIRSLSDSIDPSSSLDCVWRIQVEPRYHIVFYINEFILKYPNQCSQNFIEIYSGEKSNQPIRKFCGLSASTVFTSHHQMYIRVFLSSSSYLNSTFFSGMYSAYYRYKNCSAHSMLSCGDENCVPEALACNQRNNCPYGRDETNCHVAHDLVVRLATSSYTPLIFIIFIVCCVVSLLVFWSVYTRSFCRRRTTSYAEYLNELTQRPLQQFMGCPRGVSPLNVTNVIMSIPIRTVETEDVVMSSLEESRSDCNLTGTATTISSLSSLNKIYAYDECPRSDEEFVDKPSTSAGSEDMDATPRTAFQPYVNPNQSFDPILQEMLLSSPSHLFNVGLLPADALVSSWEQWLCLLASNLTPTQWQGYWNAYAAVFGVASVPIHLLSFFRHSYPSHEVSANDNGINNNDQYLFYG
ncbi:unnamed protein product [Auanema sp. JU1783]|nr:unnamed protein product [Auanema sp. JU1783]